MQTILEQIECAMSPAGKLFRQISLEFFLNHIEPGTRVLDCGAGDGAVSIPLAKHGCIVDAIDARPERIANLEASKGNLAVRGIADDFFSYSFEPVYDFVIARQFVAHFADTWRDVVGRMASLCRPGGAVIFHMHSSESVAQATEFAVSPLHRASVENGSSKKGAASRCDIEQFAGLNNLVVEKICPITYFHPNALFWNAGLNKEQRLDFGKELDRRLEVPEIFEFVRWMEGQILAQMPLAYASSFMAILRK